MVERRVRGEGEIERRVRDRGEQMEEETESLAIFASCIEMDLYRISLPSETEENEGKKGR